MRLRTHHALALMALLIGVACAKSEHPPSYQRHIDAGSSDAGTSIPVELSDADVAPPEDTTGLCGNQILRPVVTRPNLYLVLDRSGSMQDSMKDPVTRLSIEKWKGARQAVYGVLFTLGHRLAYGAAVFPAFGVVDSCAPGAEIDPISDGDSVTYARNGVTGPHLKRLQAALDRYVPEGATPTSSTLNTLVEPLIAKSGNTTLILATDGAPNCNVNAVCDVAHCSANLEHAPLPGGASCSASVNCCDATLYGPLFCIDVDATLLPIARLREHGIKTYVIGLPGSELFADVLERMAIAGGTARTGASSTESSHASGGAGALANDASAAGAAARNSGFGGAANASALTSGGGAANASALTSGGGAANASALTSGGGASNSGNVSAATPSYYPVTDVTELTTALRQITATLSISCTITLDTAPPDWSLVNVYFDNAIVRMSPTDGWKQIDAKTLEITGATCELLRSGDVFQVQIVAGCPTEVLI